jgi:outer membrane assembly lipoprotein YfiO
MKRWFLRLALALAVLLAWPVMCPAPLVYRPGEGWTYEPIGGGKWRRTRAKDQLETAQEAFTNRNFSVALKAAKRTVKVWPLSDFAPAAQYLVARAYEAKKWDERAFKEYQAVVDRYPKATNLQEVLGRQFEIANRFLGGQWFKIWGIIPFFPNMDKTAAMYEKLVRSAPYSEIGPQAQLNMGAAREKQKEYGLAVKAYEAAADRYHDQPKVASEALYRAGKAYQKQAARAEYDQASAGNAIGTFGDFITLYPADPRVAEAQKNISALRTEQARGSLQVAKFYEKRHRWDGALIYYNDAVNKDPNSKHAEVARERIEAIKKAVPSDKRTR